MGCTLDARAKAKQMKGPTASRCWGVSHAASLYLHHHALDSHALCVVDLWRTAHGHRSCDCVYSPSVHMRGEGLHAQE